MKRKSIVLPWTFSFLLCSAYGLYYARETKLEGLERSVSADRETVSQDDEEIKAAIKERYFFSQVRSDLIEIAVNKATPAQQPPALAAQAGTSKRDHVRQISAIAQCSDRDGRYSGSPKEARTFRQ